MFFRAGNLDLNQVNTYFYVVRGMFIIFSSPAEAGLLNCTAFYSWMMTMG
jgi:hypothetical protein